MAEQTLYYVLWCKPQWELASRKGPLLLSEAEKLCEKVEGWNDEIFSWMEPVIEDGKTRDCDKMPVNDRQ